MVELEWHHIDVSSAQTLTFTNLAAIEVYAIGAGGGGGGNGRSTGLLVDARTGWGGGGGSGGYAHLVRNMSALSQSATYRMVITMSNSGAGGAGGSAAYQDNGTASGGNGSNGSYVSVMMSDGVSTSDDITAWGGDAGTGGSSNASAQWTTHGSGGSAGHGTERIDGVDTSGTYGTGGSGTGGGDGTQGTGGRIGTGTVTYTINSGYSINLSDYGRGGYGGDGDPSSSSSEPGATGVGEKGHNCFVKIVYATAGPYTASASVSPAGRGTVSISKTSGLHYGETITYTANPGTGYYFKYWDDGSTDAVHNVTVVGNTSHIAYFGTNYADDHAFALVFSAGGGSFDSSHGPTVTASEQTCGSTSYDDTTGNWIWSYDASSSEMSLAVTVDLADMIDNLTPPDGVSFDTMDLQTPFQVLYPSTASKYNDTITFKRTTSDQICHYSVYPRWIIDRSGPQRCVITAPTLGSLDFGNIQSIKEVYSSSLTSYPTIVWGYSRNFCIDLGVTKRITVDYIRVNPQSPDDRTNNTDSRLWSNAHWIKKFKEFTDRWQMRTNGCLLYIKRPSSDEGSTESDPMNGHYPEIDGENAYITSAPISYDNTSGQRIQSSVSFTIGTLYPRETPPKMCAVTFKCMNSDGVSISSNANVTINYPCNSLVQIPTSITAWKDDLTSSTLKIWEGWDDAAITDGYLAINEDQTTKEVLSVITQYTSGSYCLADITSTTGDTRNIEWNSSGNKTLYIYAVGAGGGGGGASIARYRYTGGTATIPKTYLTVSAAGGGGGSSGGSAVAKITGFTEDTTTVRITVGTGGSAGAKGSVDMTSSSDKAAGSDGGQGGATIVEIDGSRYMTVHGGYGGKGAPAPSSVGKDVLVTCEGGSGTRIDSTAARGGNGYGYQWQMPMESTDVQQAYDGDDGDKLAQLSGGEGGTAYKYHVFSASGQTTYLSGGGGGGGTPNDYRVTTQYITIYAGNGDGGNSINGSGGGGGGGGFYVLTPGSTTLGAGDGGTGGNGYAIILAINASRIVQP